MRLLFSKMSSDEDSDQGLETTRPRSKKGGVSGGGVSSGGVSGVSGKSMRRKGSEWEILGNLESGVKYTIKPRKYEGYLSKKRKWPLKGWHKRYINC